MGVWEAPRRGGPDDREARAHATRRHPLQRLARALARRARSRAQQDVRQLGDARAYEGKLRTLKRTGALADLDAGRETLAEFVEEWWRVYAGPNLERATLRAYAILWNGHALPRLGAIPLRELTPQTIAHFRADLEQAGVGIEAIRKTMTMLQGVLQRAVEWGRVPTQRRQDDAQAAEAAAAGGRGDPAASGSR